MSIKVRDRDICRKYNDGDDLRSLARQFNLSHEGIRKILKKHSIALRSRQSWKKTRAA